jgi:hypothetical protein
VYGRPLENCSAIPQRLSGLRAPQLVSKTTTSQLETVGPKPTSRFTEFYSPSSEIIFQSETWRLACTLAISSLSQHFSYSVSLLPYFTFQAQSPTPRLGIQTLARLAGRPFPEHTASEPVPRTRCGLRLGRRDLLFVAMTSD